MNAKPRPPRTALPITALAALMVVATLTLPPIAQPQWYHDFADQRACLGLSNCLDTASNALFVLAGILGLCCVFSRRLQRIRADRREAWPYALFFGAIVLVGLVSAYYHLAPDNARLAWDRAAMTIAFMSWFAALIAERISLRAGLAFLPLLIVAGLGSVIYWIWSEAQGAGDLRPYLLVQLAPILLIPLLLWLRPPTYSHGYDVMTVIGLYLLALLLDLGDRAVFALTGGFVSGHTLKHVVAALAAAWVARHLRRRSRL